MKSQKGLGLEGLDYLEPYRIGTSGIREIPNPCKNWLNGVTICPEIGPEFPSDASLLHVFRLLAILA